MNSIHLLIYPRPAQCDPGPKVAVGDVDLNTVRVSSIGSTAFSATIETVSAGLQEIGAFVEPDGSWVWAPHGHSPPCQLGGMMYEDNDQLSYIEAEGTLGNDAWRQLYRVLTGTLDDVLVYLLPAGVFATSESFVQWHRELTK